MRLSHAALEKLLEPLKRCGRKSIKIKNESISEMCCFPVTVLYCYGIPEGEDVLNVKHGLLVQKRFIRCPSSLDNVKSVQMASCRTIQDTKSAKEVFMEFVEEFISMEVIKKNKICVKRKRARKLSNCSLSKVKLLSEDDAREL